VALLQLLYDAIEVSMRSSGWIGFGFGSFITFHVSAVAAGPQTDDVQTEVAGESTSRHFRHIFIAKSTSRHFRRIFIAKDPSSASLHFASFIFSPPSSPHDPQRSISSLYIYFSLIVIYD